MKSKPIVMDHFSTVHTSFVVDFRFTNNITILTGDSGTGRTTAFSFIQECVPINPDILCLNYLDYKKDIAGIIKSAEKRLIVIDNADVLLSDEIRKYIVLDDRNQYLIIGNYSEPLYPKTISGFPFKASRIAVKALIPCLCAVPI
jgi:hypothetical protein